MKINEIIQQKLLILFSKIMLKFYCIHKIAAKRTQSLLDFRHIMSSKINLPPTRSKTPITDLDATDGTTANSSEYQQHLNNTSNQTHNSNMINSNNTRSENNRKTTIPNVRNKNFNVNVSSTSNEEEKQLIVGEPIYQTISSEKGAKLGRNCISLENLRTLTIKNDSNSYGNNLLRNNGQESLPYYVLPAFPSNHSGSNIPQYMHFMLGSTFPMQQSHMIPPQASYFHQNCRMPFTNYGGYANPNPYSNLSTRNSRQSIGNDSDDYRKYRDVAL